MSDLPESPTGRRKKSGCLLWAILAFALILATVGGTVWWGYHWVTGQLEAISSVTAVPVSTAHDASFGEVRSKIAKFAEHFEESAPPDSPSVEQVELTVDEINTLIAESPWAAAQKLPGRVRLLSLEGGTLEVQLTWPLDNLFGSDRLDGRHLNAKIKTEISAEDGGVNVRVAGGEAINGSGIPDRLLSLLGRAITNHATGRLREEKVYVHEVSAKGGVLKVGVERRP